MNFFITNREIITNPDRTESIREDGKENAGDNLRFGTYDITAEKFTLFAEPDSTQEIVYENLATKNTDELKARQSFLNLYMTKWLLLKAQVQQQTMHCFLFMVLIQISTAYGMRSKL